MERDFMGLNSKVVVIKEEAVEGCKDSAFFKGSPVHWPLSNTFDNCSKRQSGEIQNAHSVHLPHDVKMLPGSNQAVPVTMSNPFFKTHFAAAGQNFESVPMKQQLLGGNPVTAPNSILPSNGYMAGSTEPWINSKASRVPAQLTIFYGGTVNVFDAISPEKAQAIMLLAGNLTSAAFNIAQPRAQGHAPTSKLAAEDVVFVSQPMNTTPCSGLSSPISVSSHPVGQSGGGATNNDEPAKTTGGSIACISNVEAPKIVTSHGHAAATTMISSAVPQARKASLARFLEKRKERGMNSAPYNLIKNSS